MKQKKLVVILFKLFLNLIYFSAFMGCAWQRPHIRSQPLTTGTLLGPEALPFCNGFVEVWSQIQPSETELFLKLSPQTNARWQVWNPHVVVEHPKLNGYLIKQKENRRFDTTTASGNVISWKLNVSELNPASGLKVTLKAFEGCDTSQPDQTVYLHPDLG